VVALRLCLKAFAFPYDTTTTGAILQLLITLVVTCPLKKIPSALEGFLFFNLLNKVCKDAITVTDRLQEKFLSSEACLSI